MNSFLERLPWRLAAIAALLVGGVSWLNGTEFWTCFERMGAAGAAFGAGGLMLKLLLLDPRVDTDHTGINVDHSTPPMSIDDVHDNGAESRNVTDENER